MAPFAVHTGCGVQEISGLRWEWGHEIYDTGVPVIIIPESAAKSSIWRIGPLTCG